jgi:hypothetical protein
MSYDFILFRMRRRPDACPARIPSDFGEHAVVSIDDPAPLHDALRAGAAFEAGSTTAADGAFEWHTPDGGLLSARVMAHGINIDTHAHWDHVARLFELALGVWPDAALFDLQAAQVHDLASFRAFVERSYRKKAEAEARRAAAKDAGAS